MNSLITEEIAGDKSGEARKGQVSGSHRALTEHAPGTLHWTGNGGGIVSAPCSLGITIII